MRRVPRIVIAAPRSGEGKTTVSLGLMAAFRRRGLRVQGFKVGPDYLDTGYQRLAAERPGRNLDLWMMGAEAVYEAVESLAPEIDLALIEGAMGLFDGHRDGVTASSTADVATLLEAPVILVVDAKGAAASVGALALGFRLYDEQVRVCGAILNRWAPHRDRHSVEKALSRAGVELLGALPPCTEAQLPTRHLGLVVADEIAEHASATIDRLAGLAESCLELDQILTMAAAPPERNSCRPKSRPKTAGLSEAPPVQRFTVQATDILCPSSGQCDEVEKTLPSSHMARVAVALDHAFAFYYQENLEALERAGARIVYFSPCESQGLPACDGLYLGGGYPELHLSELAANHGLLAQIRSAVLGGLPTYAECGGLMFLSQEVEQTDGTVHRLSGVIPLRVRMQERLQALGYRKAVLATDCLLGSPGEMFRGHEFHYSNCETGDAYHRGFSPAYFIDGRPEGFVRGNLFASYIHLHFAGCPQAVERWVGKCRDFRAASQGSARTSQAVVLLSHGSRSVAAKDEFLTLASLVEDKLGTSVFPSFMELASPSLDEAVAQAITQGAKEIIVVPCFLFSGNHVLEDIPAMLGNLAQSYPGVDFRFGRPLASHSHIADILVDRAREGMDVRTQTPVGDFRQKPKENRRRRGGAR